MYNAKNYIHGQGRQDEKKARGQTFLKGTDKLLTGVFLHQDGVK